MSKKIGKVDLPGLIVKCSRLLLNFHELQTAFDSLPPQDRSAANAVMHNLFRQLNELEQSSDQMSHQGDSSNSSNSGTLIMTAR